MRVARGFIVLLVPAVALGCRARDGGRTGERILCLGDSITLGVTHSSTADTPMQVDPLGGYPGRLARRLGGGVTVVNRGVGGATVGLWLTDPGTTDGRRLWPVLHRLWPDLGPEPPADASSFAAAVLRTERPDTVIILLGVNDLASEEATVGAEVDGVVADRLAALRAQALTAARTALVATLLPNHRDSADLRDRLNARIRVMFPDYLPLGERFAGARWERLLGDEVHPNEEGYELLAGTVATALRERGLVSPAAGTTSRASRP
jgi:lysophospholipase L1-like esterase